MTAGGAGGAPDAATEGGLKEVDLGGEAELDVWTGVLAASPLDEPEEGVSPGPAGTDGRALAGAGVMSGCGSNCGVLLKRDIVSILRGPQA